MKIYDMDDRMIYTTSYKNIEKRELNCRSLKISIIDIYIGVDGNIM